MLKLLSERWEAHRSGFEQARDGLEDALTASQLDVLQAVAKRPIPKRPTVPEAMLAVAGLGGHLPRNGDPGWLVRGRGMHDLLLLELGWRARRAGELVINHERPG